MSEDTNEDTNEQGTAAIRECIRLAKLFGTSLEHQSSVKAALAELAALVAAPAQLEQKLHDTRVMDEAYLETMRGEFQNKHEEYVRCIEAMRKMDRALAVRATLEMAAKLCSDREHYIASNMPSGNSQLRGLEAGELAEAIRALAPAEVIRAGEGHEAAIYNEGYEEGHADACNGILKRSQIQLFTNDQLAAHNAAIRDEADELFKACVVPLEVIAGQLAIGNLKEISEDLKHDIILAVSAVRNYANERSASVKPSTEKLYTESEVTAIRDEAEE